VTQEVPHTVPCPKCAVAVPFGYVKCPRCHAAMPPTQRIARRDRRESMREQLIAGGTAVPEPEAAPFPWLLFGVGAAAAIAAIAWYVSRGAASANATPPVQVAADDVGSAAGAATPVELEPPRPPTTDPKPRLRAEAVASLDRALASDKLWAQVSEAGDAIVIRSAFCAERGVQDRVDAARVRLGDAGFKVIRCLEKGGAPVWSRALP